MSFKLALILEIIMLNALHYLDNLKILKILIALNAVSVDPCDVVYVMDNEISTIDKQTTDASNRLKLSLQ